MSVLKIKKSDGTWQEVWGGLSGSGNGVSDYNQLQNRPFGSNGMYQTEVLPETTVEFLEEYDGTGFIEGSVLFTKEQAYLVMWNGVRYDCICQNIVDPDSGLVGYVLGNGLMVGLQGNDEPFIIISVPSQYTIAMALDGSGSATISISTETEVIDKMEGKFLPMGTPYIEPFDDVILEETVLADYHVSGDGSTRQYNIPVNVDEFIPGNIYNVILDGIIYQSKAYLIQEDGASVSYIALGSGYVGGSSCYGMPYTDEPYLIMFFPPVVANLFGANVTINLPSTNTVLERLEIRGAYIVNKINEWCMPDLSVPLVVTLEDSNGSWKADIEREKVEYTLNCGTPIFVRIMKSIDNYSFVTNVRKALGGSIVFTGYDIDGKLSRWTWSVTNVIEKTTISE